MWPVTGEFPAQKTSYAENVSIWWRHYGKVDIIHIDKQRLYDFRYRVMAVKWSTWRLRVWAEYPKCSGDRFSIIVVFVPSLAHDDYLQLLWGWVWVWVCVCVCVCMGGWGCGWGVWVGWGMVGLGGGGLVSADVLYITLLTRLYLYNDMVKS